MNDTPNPTPDPILTTLRERECELLSELADADKAVAMVNARLSEVRDLIGSLTRKKPGRRPKVTETVAEPEAGSAATGADLAI